MADLRYASFIVRLWREPAGQEVEREKLAWQGELESIQTGQTRRFQGMDALLRLMVAQLADPGYHTSDKKGSS